MMASKPAFTIGIEEEYLLVDRQTRDVVSDPPQEI
jgi:carboxylate-amine ligase